MMQPSTAAPVRYRSALDGLRAICILLTLAVHTRDIPVWINGGMGVDIFFALSGWLITWLILAERKKKGKFNLKAFYTRRFFRIVPMYALTLVLYILAALGFAQFNRPEILDALQDSLLYLATFNGEYRTDGSGEVFGHAWTLGIEEKFYIVWPLLLVLFAFRTNLAISVAVIMAGIVIAASGWDRLILRGYCGLAFGAALAVLANHPTTARFIRARGLGVPALIAMALTFAMSILAPIPHGFYNVLMSFFATFLVANLWYHDDTSISRVLAFKPLAWVGTLTYGIYLLHVLCANAVRVVVDRLGAGGFAIEFTLGYFLSVIVAWIAFRTVEKPMIEFGRKLSRSTLPAAGGFAPRVK